MKHEKKYEIMGLLDDRIYEEVLQKREALTRGGIGRKGDRLRRVLLIAACVSLLAAGVTAAFLPAMLSDPGVDSPPTAESESAATPVFDVEWVEDSTIVQVQRLSVSKSFDMKDVTTTNDNTITVGAEKRLGRRLILLSFHCRDGEKITVTPSAGGALIEAVQIEINQKLYWSVWDEQKKEYVIADEFLNISTDETRSYLGRSISITEDTVLLWQYPSTSYVCVEDNYVDFTVTDSEGSITGGGSIYIGGLDLTTVSENKTYYGIGNHDINKVYLNASYRPVLLGAYRYSNEFEVDSETHAQKMNKLRQKAVEARLTLFDDMSDDYFRLSYRVFLSKYKNEKDHGIFTSTIHQDISYDRYAYVEVGKDVKRLFFLYDGTCQPITEWETYTTDEYGYTVTSKLTLEDGTVVLVDINNTDAMYEIIPPAK